MLTVGDTAASDYTDFYISHRINPPNYKCILNQKTKTNFISFSMLELYHKIMVMSREKGLH